MAVHHCADNIHARQDVSSECVVCAKSFVYARLPSSPGRLRRFCSDACKAKRSGRRIETWTCRTCAGEYSPSYHRPAGFCSIACRPNGKLYEGAADRESAKRHRRRVRKMGGGYERFPRREIFDRDGWRCGICTKPVDPKLKSPHPMAVSLDHIIPLAAGGAHSRSNTQCAHWLCNSRKSDKGGGQLRLSMLPPKE